MGWGIDGVQDEAVALSHTTGSLTVAAEHLMLMGLVDGRMLSL